MLTNEEIDELVNAESQKGNHFVPAEFARAIEAKVMEKLEPVAYGVFDEELGWMYTAEYKEAANEHINDAIWMELQNASFWRIVPLYRKHEEME